jgi:hypothetical protein
MGFGDEPLVDGQVEEQESGQTSPSPEQKPSFVTEDRFAQLEQKIDWAVKTIQSNTDGSLNSVKKEVAKYRQQLVERAELLNAAGASITEDDIKQELADYNRKLLRTPREDGETAQSLASPNPLVQATVEKVRKSEQEIYDKYDTALTPDDPGYWRLPHGTKDPDAWLTALDVEVKKKAAKLGRYTPPTEEPAGPAGARVPGPVGNASTSDLQSQYQKAVSNPNLTKDQRLVIRQEFRAKGLKL